MNLSRFIALRIYRSSDVGKQVSRPAVLIATIGVAIGLAVMIIAVSVMNVAHPFFADSRYQTRGNRRTEEKNGELEITRKYFKQCP